MKQDPVLRGEIEIGTRFSLINDEILEAHAYFLLLSLGKEPTGRP